MANTRPNIVFIHADQFNANAISAYGNKYVKTPNIDFLVSGGSSFRASYSANPVCCPARTSWYTGLMSSEHGVVWNDIAPRKNLSDIGTHLSKIGYDCYYAGKWHIPPIKVANGFQLLFKGTGMGEYTDTAVADVAEAFLGSREGDKPFFFNAGFLNPHDICFWTFGQNPAKYEYAAVVEDELPPLPESYDKNEPTALGNERNLRYYIYSYYRMVEMVDREVGRIVQAVQNSRYADNTLIIFSADHGEMLVSHNRFTKGVLYEDSARVPLVFHMPGSVKKDLLDKEHMVNGVDVTATILDYAGAGLLPEMKFGQSLRPIVEGKQIAFREYTVSETYRPFMQTMIRKGNMKSLHSSDGVILYDLVSDPDEMRNISSEEKYSAVVAEHKALYEKYRTTIVPMKEPAGGWDSLDKASSKKKK